MEMQASKFQTDPDSSDRKPSPSLPVGYFDASDERANVWTHSLGFALSLLALAYLIRASASLELGFQVSCIAFGISLAAVYLSSTLSHAVLEPAWRNRFRAWDQGTIYVLIVATYSPFIWNGSEGWGRFVLMTSVWAAAAVGFTAKVLALHRINSVTVINYLALGWLPSIPLIATTPQICFLWMLTGGIFYSVGVIFLKISHQVRYAHAVWHLLVIAGSASHFWAVLTLIDLLPVPAGTDLP